ncbi:MAG: molybdopterin-guanine dinucleotide biosynthesis protein B [Planctomycetes bacterium]|nr:molybdopterin-guanine dinucleotide biosynthesis protein B [Planctomycetota bacterium]
MSLPPAISFVGDSGVGKTTLLVRLVEELRSLGVRVAVVKHSKEFTDPDPPQKDSARLRKAGAACVVLASPDRTIRFEDHPGAEPSWSSRLALAGPADLVLVESYRTAGLPSIEVLRAALPRRGLRFVDDPLLWAIVADFEPHGAPEGLPRFGLEDAEALARFLWGRVRSA